VSSSSVRHVLVDDPHRGKCQVVEQFGHIPTVQDWRHNPPSTWLWPALVDYAVYHAPGWEEWQKFRSNMVGTSIKEKLRRLKLWERDHAATLIETVRVLNYLRSSRAAWKGEAEMRPWADRLSKQLEDYGWQVK
jgi:hypothetical protein